MTEEKMIQLVCQICGSDYEKREGIKEAAIKYPNDYSFKNMLLYCDKCRRERIRNMLTSDNLKIVLNAIANSNPDN